MLSLSEFDNLVGRPESSILDFKKDMYSLENDTDLKKTAAFIKDIISFSNTIRKETSHIIIGIEELSDKSKQFHGINLHFDDAILQEKVKDKVYPRPKFDFYTIIYKSLKYGVFEFPITYYSTPIYPVVKMKGLEPGKVYYRNGTSNTEALGLEVIKIYDWLRTLPMPNTMNDKDKIINDLLKDLTERNKPISLILAEIYAFAQQHKLDDLLRFSSMELQGVNQTNRPLDYEIDYRVQAIIFSPSDISINPFFQGTANQIKDELKKSTDVYEYKMLFSYPITKIEEMLIGFQNPNKSVAVVKSTFRHLFSEEHLKDFPVSIYIFSRDVSNILSNIRQKAIDLLMKE